MCQDIIKNITNIVCYYFSSVKTGDLLALVALMLALIAYRKSVLDKYESWKALLQSFLDELNTQSPWIDGVYANAHEKNWFSPNKIVFKLSFESALEISRRGISDSKIISKEMYGKISLFNERVVAFNQQLDYQMHTITSNPRISGDLLEYLEEEGLSRDKVSFPRFSLAVDNLEKNKATKEQYHLATSLYNINNTIHNQLIGNGLGEDSLSFLYQYLKAEIEEKLKDYEQNIPWYFKRKNLFTIVIVMLFVFLLVERYAL